MKGSDNVSIEWESSGYSVLKNLKATIVGIFTEFIDNSIQSFKNDKDKIKLIEPGYQLKVSIKRIGDEIIIEDNAGGIDEKNFYRALKPANKADDTKGLNEFGLGMKYAAVWISNEWELISSSFGEDLERRVIFNYHDVVNKNLKDLPVFQKTVEKHTHYTKVKLRNLEQSKIKGFKPKLTAEKIAFVYRNFLREDKGMYSDYCEEPIEINWNMGGKGTKLEWKEYGFLNAKWYKDSLMNKDTKPLDWVYKLNREEIPTKETVIDERGNQKEVDSKVMVSGFIGVLPKMEQGKNGFALFRRGRVVEGIDSRVFPRRICGPQSGAAKYKRLYGEIHFSNIKVSFDKSQLTISPETRDYIFFVISSKLKQMTFGLNETKYNMIAQAEGHRLNTGDGKKAAEEAHKKRRKKSKTLDDEFKDKKASQTIIDESYLQKEEALVDKFVENAKNELPKIKPETIEVSGDDWEIITSMEDFAESPSEEHKIYTYRESYDEKKLYVQINSGHEVFDSIKSNEEAIILLQNTIVTLAISELHASQGDGEAKHLRHKFNNFSHRLNKY